MTPDEASRKAHLLHSFRALVANPAWTEEVAPRIAKAVIDHNDGCKALSKTPVERAEHVQAVHLAEELMVFAQNRIAVLERDLRQHSATYTSGSDDFQIEA